MENCVMYEGRPVSWHNAALDVLFSEGVTLFAWDTVVTTCDEPTCLNADHLRVIHPRALAYPPYVCVYCGEPGSNRDHLLPETLTGVAVRRGVLTVPSCGECNGILGDLVIESITLRRAYVQARLRKRHRKILATIELGPTDLAEYEPSLRGYVMRAMSEKQVLLDRLAWPGDVSYDHKHLQDSGIPEPALSGLVRPVDASLWSDVRTLLS